MSMRSFILRLLELLCIPFSKCSHFKSSCCSCECDKNINEDNNDNYEDN